jgi:HK97 family phage major capsid protein
MVLQERAEDGETYLATDWEPYEVSIVSVPADASVGIGRSTSEVVMTRIISTGGHADKEDRKMSDKQTSAPKTAEDQTEKVTKVESGNNEALKLEEDRVKGIRNLCRANDLGNEYAEQWIRQGRSILDVIEDWGEIQAARTKTAPAAKLGLNSREVQEYSLTRAILACATKDWDKAGYELECSQAVASRTGKTPDPHTFIVPLDVLEAPRPYRRDMTAAVDAQGGFVVETSVQGFIELLRNRSVAFNMGARRLSGLQGDVAIPRQSAAATALWLTNEATQITEADQTLEQLTLTPRTVGAYTEISRQLLLQSNPSIEAIVNADLAAVVATAVDKAVLDGSGAAGQPTGISETVGIGAVSGVGFLAAAFDRVMEFQEDVAAANVMPLAGGYVTTPALASTMLQTVRFTSTDAQLWDGNLWDGTMAGFRAMSSNQVEAAEMFFGDWSEVLIGEWGILEVTTNPYANFQAGIIGVRAIYSVDVGLRHAAAFAFATAIA